MLSRRTLFLAGAGACFASDPPKGVVYPSDAHRYADRVTEFPLVRLTSPEYSSILPAYYNRAIAGKSFVVICSDRAGKMDAYAVDLKSGEMRRLTDCANILPSSIDLLPGDRSFICADGNALNQVSLSNLRARELYRASGDIVAASASPDGTHAAVIERSSGHHRLVAVHMSKGGPRVLVETPEPLAEPVHRPRRDSILYRRAGNVWLAYTDERQNYRLKMSANAIGTPQWSPDGRSVLYLSIPEDTAAKTEIRDFNPDTGDDNRIAPTTRYVEFRTNGDGSVFVGASGSIAAPHVLLLLRSVKREFTLCEHRASDPKSVAPVFSPNSQRIFFNSDQHGKPAVYMMNVDRLVEET